MADFLNIEKSWKSEGAANERKRIIKIIASAQSTEAQRQAMSKRELQDTILVDEILGDIIDKIDA